MPLEVSNDRFGWLPALAPRAVLRLQDWLRSTGRPATFRSAAPHLFGLRADRYVSLHDVYKKVFGDWHPSQNQPRGTCVSRGAKMIADLTQAVVIAAGEPLEYGGISHSWIYGACREHGGGLGDQDGATGAWAAWSVHNDGVLRNSDVDDDDNSDTLAVKWGKTGVPKGLRPDARKHLIKEIAQVRDTDALATGLQNYYGATCASDVGFEPSQRDKDGVCAASGYWPHQMCVSGVNPDHAGRGRHFQLNQSWGRNVPGGPIGPVPMPDYSFWVSERDMQTILDAGDSWFFSGIMGWLAQLLAWDV